MARLVTVVGKIDGLDDEGFFGGSDETGHTEFNRVTVLSDDQPQNVMSVSYGWGGECRAELELVGQMNNDGAVTILGTFKLFEGTSESTPNLRAQKDFSFLVPRKKTIPNTQKVEWSGGDWALVVMNVSNALNEED